MRTAPRDWWRILRDLRYAGISIRAVARKVNRDHTTVLSWSSGAEPKESDARMVLALYAKHCPEQYARDQVHYSIAGAAEADIIEAAILARLILLARQMEHLMSKKEAQGGETLPLFGDRA